MFAAKMIELDEKIRHLHERIDDGEHKNLTALMGELNALAEEYNLEQDAIRYRLAECKVPKIQALISTYNEVQERMHNAAEGDPDATWNENVENTALLAEYALDFAILAADRALLLSLKAIQEQKEASKIELQQGNLESITQNQN